MFTALITHPAFALHDTGPGHPEGPARLAAVLSVLDGEAYQYLERHVARPVPQAALLAVHPQSHIDAVMAAVPEHGHAHIDGDTVLSPASGKAAMLAAGAVCDAVDLVATGRVRNAFCAVRPPGHHAEPDRALGFCLFSNAAIGAMHARNAHGLDRVAVIDFDVHHGNGTQKFFEADAGLFYASTHQSPLFPGTGAREDTGIAENIVNVPLPAGADGDALQAAWNDVIAPALARFGPDLIIVSAGFDAHRADPLAGVNFTTGDFEWITEQICATADRLCKGRIVSVLEGGYELQALSESVAVHVSALMRQAA